MTRHIPVLAVSLMVGACDLGVEPDAAGNAADAGTRTEDAGSGDAGRATDAGGPVDAGTALQSLGSLVILGDSISSGGGAPPYYFDVLLQNLRSRYGQVRYRNQASSGSTTAALRGQIDALPATMPGPVAVVITSGTNDLQPVLPQALAGAGGDAAALRAMGTNIDGAIGALLAKGRFGAGVEVRVFYANIYDSSDGVGDFGLHCPIAPGAPVIPTAPVVARWNGEIAAQVAAHGQTLIDVHAAFFGHGYAGNPSWFEPDCSHPNALGHAALAHVFGEAIAR